MINEIEQKLQDFFFSLPNATYIDVTVYTDKNTIDKFSEDVHLKNSNNKQVIIGLIDPSVRFTSITFPTIGRVTLKEEK